MQVLKNSLLHTTSPWSLLHKKFDLSWLISKSQFKANGEDSLYLPTSTCQHSFWTPPNLSQKLFSFSLLVAQYFIGKKKLPKWNVKLFAQRKKRGKNGRHTYSLFTVIKKYEISYYIRIINTHSFVLTIFFMWILTNFSENHNCQILEVNYGSFKTSKKPKKKIP